VKSSTLHSKGKPLHEKQGTQALFSVAVESIVGNGQTTLFWSGCRLQGEQFVSCHETSSI
jgi:hypothetical protein